MDENKLKKLYNELVNDSDFDKLELGLNKPNIFEILKISKSEIRHSNFLSWLLNPKGSHGLGEVFIKRFIREIFSSDKVIDIDQIEVSKLNLSIVEIRREWKNIDILIIFDDIIICIENKVYSKEHSNQLKRYKEIINNEFPDKRQSFVYLTPYGDSSEEETESYVSLSYYYIIEILDRIIEIYDESLIVSVKQYIKDYLTILRREIMGEDALSQLSRRIYYNHQEIIDFINESKPDALEEVNNILKKILESKGFIIGSPSKSFVRFTTSKIKDVTYYNKNKGSGWQLGETFLFELYLQQDSGRISFKTVFCPTDDEYDNTKMINLAIEATNSTRKMGAKWIVPYMSHHDFNFYNQNEEETELNFEAILEEIIPIINKIENKLMDHKEELLKLKNI